ncbi:MAG: hypothetical protein M3Y21_09285 [Candidatus Eremiobacteraeota bacterium]|nr:hypothetical protein [Candidatus Eremiobacteraeota bacterium]
MGISPLARAGRTAPAARPAGKPAEVEAAAPLVDVKDDVSLHLQEVFDREQIMQTQQQLELQAQRDAYDFRTQERAEMTREYNDTRNFILDQMKQDDEILKKWIAMI